MRFVFIKPNSNAFQHSHASRSTHLLYSSQNLPMGLLTPMPESEFPQVHTEPPQQQQEQKALLSESLVLLSF